MFFVIRYALNSIMCSFFFSFILFIKSIDFTQNRIAINQSTTLPLDCSLLNQGVGNDQKEHKSSRV